MNTKNKLILLLSCLAICFNGLADCNDYVPGQVLVKMKPNQSKAQKINLKTEMQALSLKTFPKLGIELWDVSTHSKNGKINHLIEQFKNHPDIEYIEPNYRYELSVREDVQVNQPMNKTQKTQQGSIYPNDPQFINQWYLDNIGLNVETPDVDINAPEAWDILTESPDVKVAILNTGIDWTHEDLVNNIWQNLGEDADGDGQVLIFQNGKWIFDPDDENGKDDDGNGYIDDLIGWDFTNADNNPFDGHGHGTRMAGIIGAEGNNSIGICGMSWNIPLAGLKMIRDNGAANCADIIETIQYAVDMNFQISNNCWNKYCEDVSFSMYDAIEYAKANDHLFIATVANGGFDSIGDNNDGDNPTYPASYKLNNIISVTSIDAYGALSHFADYGQTSVDIAAPGENIFTTSPDNTYVLYDGTSTATSQVTAACALLWQLNPEYTYLQIKEKLINSVTASNDLADKCVSGGRLNLHKLLIDENTTDVYPGDLNHDGIVNYQDVGWIGTYLTEIGPPRAAEHQNTDWYPHPAQDWGTQQLNNEDIKHHDCNGDGFIDGDDEQSVHDNMGEIWENQPDPNSISIVYPGDLNHDGTVNNVDFSLSGLYKWETGFPRAPEHQNTDWTAHPAQDWGTQQLNGEDIKHFDCNGDGIIDDNDHQAIVDNWGWTWSIPNPPPISNTNFQIVLYPLEEIEPNYLRMNVALESINGADLVLQGGYFIIDYGGQNLNVVDATMNFNSSSWLGPLNLNLTTTSLNFPSDQKLEVGFSRVDGTNATGSGVIGELILHLDNSAARLSESSNCMFNIQVKSIGMHDSYPNETLVENRQLQINLCEGTCENEWYINDDTQFQNEYKSNNLIETDGFLIIGDEQQVEYKANRVCLRPGFKVRANASFKAGYGNCN